MEVDDLKAALSSWKLRALRAESELAEARAAPSVRQTPHSAGLDGCSFCLGHKGGRKETIGSIQGAPVCLACADLFRDLFEAMQRNAVKAPDPTVMEGAEDVASAEMGALIRKATDTAHDHAAAEARGELVSLTSPPRIDARGNLEQAEVTDPDEIEMIKARQALNMTVCPTCMNTGWRGMLQNPGTGLLCPCPSGVLVGKKLAAAHRAGLERAKDGL
jgi:hypothetical protein